MHISFSPVRSDASLSISKSGDALTINDEVFDFGPLPDGATLPSDGINSGWFAGPVTREGGKLRLALVLPHGPNPTEAARFPQTLIDPPNGPLALPA